MPVFPEHRLNPAITCSCVWHLSGTSLLTTIRGVVIFGFALLGIAANSLIAKIASDWNKPNGQFIVEPTVEAVEEFISTLPIRKVSVLLTSMRMGGTLAHVR